MRKTGLLQRLHFVLGGQWRIVMIKLIVPDSLLSFQTPQLLPEKFFLLVRLRKING